MKERTVRCKLCHGEARHICDVSNSHSKTRILHCFCCMERECGIVFIGNDIDSEELQEAYSTLDTEMYYKEIAKENEERILSAVEDCAQTTTLESRVIDVGGGNGQFVCALLDRGYRNLSIHEIAGSDLSELRDKEIITYEDYDYTSIPSSSFDCVTLLDVAEHVIDPHFLFRACYRILDDGGALYFHTPIVTRLDRLMHLMCKIPILASGGRTWQRGRTSIFHLQNYTTSALEAILKDCGFINITVVARNELSWPVSRYIKVYLLSKLGIPAFFAWFLLPFIYPFLKSDFFNPNKAIMWARKPSVALGKEKKCE